jgi:hypothetical protein
MKHQLNITKKTASLLLVFSLFILPLTSGYVSLNCELRQETGLSCCSSAGSHCCETAPVNMVSYQKPPCCPCSSDNHSAIQVLPDFELLTTIKLINHPVSIHDFQSPITFPIDLVSHTQNRTYVPHTNRLSRDCLILLHHLTI